MSLDLDDRRIAMLERMGISLPMPARAASAPAAVAAPVAVPVAAPVATPAPTPAPVAAAAPVRARVEAPAFEPRPEPAGPAPVNLNLKPRAEGIDQMDWDTLRGTVAACEACALCARRRNTVFGVGPVDAHWMVIGEAPGENEDIQGEPFVGQAGKLLDNMLRSIGLSREGQGERGVYIANVLKCRPPANRNPEPHEMVQCEPYLKRQIALVKPRIILAMGRFAVQALLRTSEPIGKLRGREHVYEGVPLVVTYHPAYLLRNLPDKARAWADLCLAQSVVRPTEGPR